MQAQPSRSASTPSRSSSAAPAWMLLAPSSARTRFRKAHPPATTESSLQERDSGTPQHSPSRSQSARTRLGSTRWSSSFPSAQRCWARCSCPWHCAAVGATPEQRSCVAAENGRSHLLPDCRFRPSCGRTPRTGFQLPPRGALTRRFSCLRRLVFLVPPATESHGEQHRRCDGKSQEDHDDQNVETA